MQWWHETYVEPKKCVFVASKFRVFPEVLIIVRATLEKKL